MGQKKITPPLKEKKITQPLGTKKSTNLSTKKSCNLLGQKKITKHLRTKKNNATCRDKKIMQPLVSKKITQLLGGKKSRNFSRQKMAKVQFTNLVNKIIKTWLIFCLTKTMLTKSIKKCCHPKPRLPSSHNFFRLIHSSKPKPENLLYQVFEINRNYPHNWLMPIIYTCH